MISRGFSNDPASDPAQWAYNGVTTALQNMCINLRGSNIAMSQ